jgi:hypothetical protein
MTKIVINTCFGGFGLSDKALKMLGREDKWEIEKDRTNPQLVKVVEELGHEADGDSASLSIVEIPKGTYYQINEYDGQESVETEEEWKKSARKA